MSKNLGSTCYFNATAQALITCTYDKRDNIIDYEFLPKIINTQFVKIFTSDISEEPYDFTRTLETINKALNNKFNIGRQHSADELLLYLLYSEPININLSLSPTKSIDNEKIVEYIREKKLGSAVLASPINSLIISVSENLDSKEIDYETSTISLQKTIVLNSQVLIDGKLIDDTRPINERINKFFNIEVNPNNPRKIYKKHLLFAGNFLILVRNIDKLNLTKGLITENVSINTGRGSEFNYELIAMIKHIGTSVESGHYISICKRKRWFIFDDSSVYETDIKRELDNLEGQITVIIYKRI